MSFSIQPISIQRRSRGSSANKFQRLSEVLDVTMLAVDMGVTDIPVDHPDAENFLPRTLLPDDSFDLILCDGQVLRTHPRASYPEAKVARRLAASQLALGLERVRPGGTMIVLLHRIELWSTVCLLHIFSKFSSLTLFKPTAGHARRSSFYMGTTEINPQHPEAELAIEKWKKIYKTATFGTQDEYETVLMEGDKAVEEVLEEFGSELIRLGKKIWRIQAKPSPMLPSFEDQRVVEIVLASSFHSLLHNDQSLATVSLVPRYIGQSAYG